MQNLEYGVMKNDSEIVWDSRLFTTSKVISATNLRKTSRHYRASNPQPKRSLALIDHWTFRSSWRNIDYIGQYNKCSLISRHLSIFNMFLTFLLLPYVKSCFCSIDRSVGRVIKMSATERVGLWFNPRPGQT